VKRKDHFRQLTDEEVIDRVRQGDIDAFEWIVKRYESTVANTIYGILGNISGAEDLGQEVFIRAYHGLYHFRHRAQFKTYLTRIAINVCMDAIKKNDKHIVPIQNEDQFKDRLLVDSQREYDLKDLVQSALYQLDRDQRMVVVLRFLEGYSTRETAGLLKIPEGTVLSRLSRGLARLRQILEKEWLLIFDETSEYL
jgi:RNA polymerase sigma-70 factor (ECF subfamily)